MTNNERLQANNAELREAIEMAEKLPDAGGGTPTPTQEKTVDITKNGTVEVTPDDGYALSKVTANVDVPIPDGYIVPSGTKDITSNGTHSVTEFDEVNVNVPIPDGYEDVTTETNEYTAKLEALETAIAELEDVLESKASGGGSYNFEWARIYEIEIGANSIKNATDTVAYIKTLVASYSTSLIILMSPLTVNNQLVLCGANGVTRCRDGKIANTTVGTAYDMFIPEGTKYLVLEKRE